MINYQTMLKSDSEIKQEENSAIDGKIDKDIYKIAKEQWLSASITKKCLLEVEEEFTRLMANLFDQVRNPDVSNEQFRMLALEVATVKATLNLLYAP